MCHYSGPGAFPFSMIMLQMYEMYAHAELLIFGQALLNVFFLYPIDMDAIVDNRKTQRISGLSEKYALENYCCLYGPILFFPFIENYCF